MDRFEEIRQEEYERLRKILAQVDRNYRMKIRFVYFGGFVVFAIMFYFGYFY